MENTKIIKLIFLLLILALFSGVLQAFAPVIIITPNSDNPSAGGWFKSFSNYTPYNPPYCSASAPPCWGINFTDKADMYMEVGTNFMGNIATEFNPDSNPPGFPFGELYPIDKLDTLQADVDIDIKQASYSSSSNVLRYVVVMAVQRQNGPAVINQSNITYTELDFWDNPAAPAVTWGQNTVIGGHNVTQACGGNVAEYKLYYWENSLNQWNHFHVDFLPFINATLQCSSDNVSIHAGDKLLWVYVAIESIGLDSTSEVLVDNFSVTANGYCYILYKTINDSYGAKLGDSKWDPHADVNKDCKVTTSDLANFGLNQNNELWCHARLNDSDPCKANLTQAAAPPSPIPPVNLPFNFTPTFICNYSDANGNSISGATVGVQVDNTAASTTYNASAGDYRSSSVVLGVGSHQWHCSASKAGYQTQISPAQDYPVNASTTLTVTVDEHSPCYLDDTNCYDGNIIFSADYNFTLNGVSSSVGVMTNPDVIFYFDGDPCTAGFTGNRYPDLYYGCSPFVFLGNHSPGTHAWYFTATAPGFQPQTSPVQTYVVTQHYYQSSPNLCAYYRGDSASCGSSNNFCPSGTYFPNQPCSNTQATGCTSGFCTICGDCSGTSDTCAVAACGTINQCNPNSVCTGQGTGSSNCAALGFTGATCYCDGMCLSGSCVNNKCLAPTPLAALKTDPRNGYGYIPYPIFYPNIARSIKIEEWCNMSDTDCQNVTGKYLCGCARMQGDQTGGKSPYPNINNWPNGKVDLGDLNVLSKCYRHAEVNHFGPDSEFNYMADIIPNRKCELSDLSMLSRNYNQINGTYSTDLSNINVTFDNGVSMHPDSNGYIPVPPGLANLNFTIYNGSKPVMALVTFWNFTPDMLNASKAQTTGAPAVSEEAPQIPISDTWTFAVAILAIVGLVIGYFILREAIFIETTKTRKRRRK